MQALEVLHLARSLVEDPAESTVGLWPRAAALLGRQALESALKEAWERLDLDMSKCSQRSQLLCLGEAIRDRPLGQETNHVWWALTQACHHQVYQLPPTDTELKNWFDSVEELSLAIRERLRRT